MNNVFSQEKVDESADKKEESEAESEGDKVYKILEDIQPLKFTR